MVRTVGAAAVPAICLCVAASGLAACGPLGWGLGERGEASRAIARFLAAANKGDQAGFEAGIDRKAVRADLADQMAELGRAKGLDIGEPPSEFVLDRMIDPQAVRAAAARTAPGWPAEPTARQIVPRMKVRDMHHVCLEQQAAKRCLLVFAKEDGAWRLVAIPARAAAAQQPLAP